MRIPNPKSRIPNPDFGVAELSGSGSRVAIIPALGGKISALELGGRQWLWTNDAIGYRPPVDEASYAETADSGGLDECFPTVAPCNLSPEIPRYGGLALPDHGELWSQPATFSLTTHDRAQKSAKLRAKSVWLGRRLPYRFRRSIHIDSSGAVVMRYAVSNKGEERIPFIWSAQAILPITPQTQIGLPENARVRVYSQHGIDLLGTGAEHRWPRLRSDKGEVDMSRPDAVRKAYACKLFLDMPSGRGGASVFEGSSRLDLEFDVEQVPNFGVWINRRGWTPVKRGKPYLNFAFAPCIGVPDSLSDALGSWNSAHWLERGERREWTVTWRAG